jgi:arylsulfatase A-like enzyme/cytochrome c-type biogenesis protein CcmH/NrfG
MANVNQTGKKTTKRKIRLIAAIVSAIILIAVIIYSAFGRKLPGISGGQEIKNVILITIDTLRADYLSCYKKGTAQTPNLDQLALEGIRFEQCIAQNPLTLPSHTSILSATYPLHHRVRDNGGLRAPEQLELISEVLKKEGMTTSAFIAAYVLHSKWGLNQGFDHYSDDFDLTRFKLTGTVLEKRAEIVLEDARKWISAHKEEPFFSWIHLFDPHADYEPPPPYDKKYPDNPYAGEVEYTDAQLGRFFKFLKEQGLYENSLIIVTSDHGEGLWDHGERSHGFFVYGSTVRVPLIIRAPERFPVKTVNRMVELVDIAPTILDFLGVDIPKSYQGASLLPLTEDPQSSDWKKETAYAETYYPRLHLGWSHLQALYHKNWKYIRAPKEELYNIEEDSSEANNQITQHPDKKKNLKNRLVQFIASRSKHAISQVKNLELDPADKQRLESLGYITSRAAAVPDTKGELPDPKDKVDFFETFDNARMLMRKSKFAEVIAIMEKTLEKETGNVDAMMLLGVANSKHGFPGKAIPLMYKVLESKPDYNDAMVNLVNSLFATGKTDLAIKEAKRFLVLSPEDYVLLNLMGEAYLLKEQYKEALKHLTRSLEIEPRNSKALLAIGEVYLEQKNYARSRTYIDKALDIYPKMHKAYFLLGRIEEERGYPDLAMKHFRKELEHFPGNYIAVFHLAELLKKSNRYAEAIPLYRRALDGNPSFKLPYFMIANYYMESGINLQEAIDLCKKGIGIQPHDESTLFGYFILTNVYAKLDDQANLQYYTSEGDKLYKALQEKKK